MGTHHFADGRLALGQRVSAGNLQAQLIYQAYGRMPPTPETKKVIWPTKKKYKNSFWHIWGFGASGLRKAPTT
jgi:hypothetical protein